MGKNGKVWHPEAIIPSTKQTLVALQEASILGGFYLAGGTGLALQIGHRRSIDLDFFSAEPVNEDGLLRKIEPLPGFSLAQKDRETLHLTIGDTKVSFLGYPYPLFFPCEEFLSVPVADPRDIACMKVSAVLSRGKKRDFIDLYFASRQYSLEVLLQLFEKKFARSHYNPVSVLKSLLYFEDAEDDPMPEMLLASSWSDIKDFFRSEVPRLK